MGKVRLWKTTGDLGKDLQKSLASKHGCLTRADLAAAAWAPGDPVDALPWLLFPPTLETVPGELAAGPDAGP